MDGTGSHNSGEQAADAGCVVFSPHRYDNTPFLVACVVHGCACGRWQEGQVHNVVENQDEGDPFTRDKLDCDAGIVYRILCCVTASTAPYPRSFLFNSNKHPYHTRKHLVY
jgi:hypothetical protein